MVWFPLAQAALYALSLAAPATMWIMVVQEVADPWVAAYATVACAICCWTFILLCPFADATASTTQRWFSLVFYWGLIGGLFPIVWDGTWTIMNRHVRGVTEQDTWWWYWWSYAKTDTRFLKSDHSMIIVETWSPILGMVQLYALHLLIKGKVAKSEGIAWTAGWLQFYGCTILFGMELLGGHSNITPGFLDCVMSFWMLNGFWLFMPFVACWGMKEMRESGVQPAGTWWNALCCRVALPKDVKAS